MKHKSHQMNIASKTKELDPAKGLLEVAGHLDLSQFWPAGTSDADTAHFTPAPLSCLAELLNFVAAKSNFLSVN